jgi:hypothetical protein
MRQLIASIVVALTISSAAPAFAQLNGENLLGDTGVGNGTQAAPGFYVAGFFYKYNADTIRKADGTALALDPTQPAEATLNAFAPLVVFVSPTKILGANYGMMAVVPFANAALEAPAFGFQATVDSGLGDIYILPVTLGWHLARANVNAAAGLFAPSGRYDANGHNNLGKGMWSWELSTGTTVFLDPRKSWSVATSAFWETHTQKTESDVKVGQLLTLEGGVGKSFLQGAMSVGVAYYAQWKLTDDRFGVTPNLPTGLILDKHRVYGLGPDITIPIATRSKLISLVNIRYMWETGARVKTEGQSLLITTTFPIPSVRII